MRRSAAIFLLGASLALSGCSMETFFNGGKPVNHLPTYQPDDALHFGDWLIEPTLLQKRICRIDGNTADVQITTDGKFSDNFIQLRLAFELPLVHPPKVILNSYPVALPIEGPTDGSNKIYSIQVLYDPTTAADLLTSDTFLTLHYQMLSQAQPREVSLATRGLVHALAALGHICGHNR